MSLTSALNSATSGLNVSQKALSTVSNNIANAESLGYTRKVIYAESVAYSGVNSGVRASGIIRYVDEALTKNICSQLSDVEYYRQLNEYYSRIQNLFGSTDSPSSIAHQISQLNDLMQQLAAEPTDSTRQLLVITAMRNVVAAFNTIGADLSKMRTDADQAIETTVNEINSYIDAIHQLNRDIGKASAQNRDVTTMLDQRDYYVQLLSELIDVNVMDMGNNTIGLYTKDGITLLDAQPYTLVHNSLASTGSSASHAAGDIYGIQVVGADGKLAYEDITGSLTGARLGALIEMRDSTLVDLEAQMDELAVQIQSLLNQVHNRGVSYSSLTTEMNGTRTFLDPSKQTISFADGTDSSIVLMSPDGTEFLAKSMVELLKEKYPGRTGTPPAYTVAEVMSAMEDWLQNDAGLAGAEVTFNKDGTYSINLHTNDLGLAFYDVNAAGDWDDAVIAFDMNGDGDVNQTVGGFSNFFGFNDLITRGASPTLFDSEIRSKGWTANTAGELTFCYADSTGTLQEHKLTIGPNDTLESIAKKINDQFGGDITASVVPEGNGYRLRISSHVGNMDVGQTGGDINVLSALGLGQSKCGAAREISLNELISNDPSLIATHSLVLDPDTGKLKTGSGNSVIANQMNDALASQITVPSTGGLVSSKTTLTDFATSIVSQSSTKAYDAQTKYENRASVLTNMIMQQGSISEVNVNEEFAELIRWQRMFQASAKVISTVSDMMDVLMSTVR